MLEELFTQLYKKLEYEKGNDKKSKNGYFEYFVNVILKNDAYKAKGFVISNKAVKNYYEKYVEKKVNKSGEPKNDLKNVIAQYLGFENYLDFEQSINKTKINTTKNKKAENKKRNPEKTNKVSKTKKLLIILSILLIFPVIYFLNNPKNSKTCIIWVDNHFEKNNCTKKNSIDNAIYNINIENFKQIEVTPKTEFFKSGNPMIWYGKSSSGKITFFTAKGIQPETLVDLKPVSEYIINKYVYTDSEDKTILNVKSSPN